MRTIPNIKDNSANTDQNIRPIKYSHKVANSNNFQDRVKGIYLKTRVFI